MLILEIVVVLALFVLNGFFAMAELAIFDLRAARIWSAWRRRGDRERMLPSRLPTIRRACWPRFRSALAQARRPQELSAARPSPNGSPKRCWPFLSWQTMASRFP